MKIQNILLPQIGICTEETLFFQRESGKEREIKLSMEREQLTFREYGHCSFGTYFNGISVEKWKKYTNIGDISLYLRLSGDFEVNLLNFDKVGTAEIKTTVSSSHVSCEEPTWFRFPYQLYDYKGILAFTLTAERDGSVFYGGYYDAEFQEEKLWPVNLAINICTFKREPFVKRNLDNLRSAILENPESELYGHLRVYISDNGQTLPISELESDSIRIVPNKNVGGAGGFTRGLMEIMGHMDEFEATHALMMDDDIVIEPESFFRTYMLLRCRKEKYEDMFIGGAMLRLDNPIVQVESGASWNAGALIPNKCNLKLDNIWSCVRNEIEEYTEYNAWWYCCTPMKMVTKENLPLPIFIRGDDLEYGLRNMKTLVLMNGICVWHEAFENKYSSFLYYYILRNLLYDNALHFPKYSKTQLLSRLFYSVQEEILFYRYKNVDLLLRGVDDFLKGVDFLKNTDGEKLHKEIMASGYKAQPLEDLEDRTFRIGEYEYSLKRQEDRIDRIIRRLTLNGHLLPAHDRKEAVVVPMAGCRPLNFYRVKTALNYDPNSKKAFITHRSWAEVIRCSVATMKMSFKILFGYDKAIKSFRERYHELTSEEAWNAYLN